MNLPIPPIPAWTSLHPLIIHFPIGLLLVSPLLMGLSLVMKSRSRAWGESSLLLLILGTASAFLAAETGEAAMELVERTAAVAPVLDLHSEMAEKIPWIYLGISLAWTAFLILPGRLQRPLNERTRLLLGGLIVAASLGSSMWLSLAAHQGGLLVHRLGVRALF